MSVAATTNTTATTGAKTDVLASGQSNLNTSYDTFLQLLTAQLKNQDPTSPLDPNAFTQQLVQMTGVQQQLLTNELLQSLVNQGGGAVQSAVGLIGKTATATTDQAVYQNGKAQWSYDLGGAASQANLSITDPSGRVVWTGSAPDLSSGPHTFTWTGDGKAANGATYKLNVQAVDSSGAAMTATTSVSGLVDSVRQASGQTLVKIGGVEAPLSSVTSVSAG